MQQLSHLKRVAPIVMVSVFSGGMWTAAMAADLRTADVLGFHFGMTPDEVKELASQKIENLKIRLSKGKLSMGTFETEEIVFGLTASSGVALSAFPEEKQEIMSFVFNLNAPNNLQYISRKHRYSVSEAPSVEAVLAAMKEKYGEPSGTSRNEYHWEYYWIQTQAGTPVSSNPDSCISALESTTGLGLASHIYNGHIEYDPKVSFAKCGITAALRLSPQEKNDKLVRLIEFDIGDIDGMYESNKEILDHMATGASGASEDLLKNAPKPAL